jgi:hypothetical protein
MPKKSKLIIYFKEVLLEKQCRNSFVTMVEKGLFQFFDNFSRFFSSGFLEVFDSFGIISGF